MRVFIDSNIPMYVAGREHPNREPARSFGVRDAIHAAVMLNNDVTSIATFDSAFDRVPGVSRLSL
jgi:predicted nucleic acid-binding protein